jgi:hypothetical protein
MSGGQRREWRIASARTKENLFAADDEDNSRAARRRRMNSPLRHYSWFSITKPKLLRGF